MLKNLFFINAFADPGNRDSSRPRRSRNNNNNRDRRSAATRAGRNTLNQQVAQERRATAARVLSTLGER